MFSRNYAPTAASVVFLTLMACVAADAQTQPRPAASPSPLASPERVSIHVQATNVQQYHGAFPAAYSGPQSIAAQADTAKTIDATLFLGARIGKRTEVYINPEVDQGFGLGSPPQGPGQTYNGTFGAAGFPSAEAYKVGRDSSYGRIQRIFVRQTFDLGGGDPQAIDPDINQLGGITTPKHLTLTAGKFGAVDVFDANVYAHDPKNDFLNWTIVDMGAFDYPADAWGYTYGIAAELATATNTTYRAGLFQLSKTPNQIAIEPTPLNQYGAVVEIEQRTAFFGGRPGAIKVLAYADSGSFGSYADALDAAAGTGQPPSTASVRYGKHAKAGGGINLAQEIAPHLGIFARASAMNGTYEADEFTDVDRSFSFGASIDGGLYHRPNDTFGVAGALNALSAPAQQYFGAGGVGILVGDGALSYGGERILETYYKIGLTKNAAITADYQRITNPAYNTVRGPIAIFGLRYHGQL